MKTRKGFVTNSSSSSFVIVLNNSTSADVIKNKKELDKYILEQMGYNTIDEMLKDYGEYKTEEYNNWLKTLDAGKQIYFGSISNDDYYSDLVRTVAALGFKLHWEET